MKITEGPRKADSCEKIDASKNIDNDQDQELETEDQVKLSKTMYNTLEESVISTTVPRGRKIFSVMTPSKRVKEVHDSDFRTSSQLEAEFHVRAVTKHNNKFANIDFDHSK